MTQPDLFDWLAKPYEPGEAVAWRPEPLDREQWPPDYKAVYAWRIKQLKLIRSDPNLAFGAREYYRTHKAEFIMDWMDTYNPRVVGAMKWMPFVFFRRQAEFIQFLEELERDQESGLVEKARDVGLTWLCCAYSVAKWLFDTECAVGWGSRKEDLVDKNGDPDSIFEKMRLILRRLPKEFLPAGFIPKAHATHMRLLNPENGSVIMGEAGDNIGRGGRKTIYFKDESAHYERPELIEGALGDNTNVQVDISSVNGLGNVFHRKRENGVDWQPGGTYEQGATRVFVVDWSDHPAKTPEWYDRRKAKWENDGLGHIFAQEVDRNYSAALANTIIAGEWIKAAIDAHLKFRWVDDKGIKRLGISEDRLSSDWMAALDVADGGGDRNALVSRQGIILRTAKEWGARDTGVTTRHTMTELRPHKGILVQYDSIGVGAGVKSDYNRLVEDGTIGPNDFTFVPWNAGAAVMNPWDHIIEDDPESARNKDFFANFKAQAWWSLRMRFWRTYQNIVQGVLHDPDEMISLDSTMPLLRQIEKELAQPTISPNGALKQVVDKKPDGTRSPNIADAIVMCYFPVEHFAGALSGTYSNAA